MPVLHRVGRAQVAMNYNDHNPPHVHPYLKGHGRSRMEIRTGEFQGSLPPRVEREVREWVLDNQALLLECWEDMLQGRPLRALVSGGVKRGRQ